MIQKLQGDYTKISDFKLDEHQINESINYFKEHVKQQVNELTLKSMQYLREDLESFIN